LVGGELSTLGIIWNGYRYNENPLFASYNFVFWVLAIGMFIGAYFVYNYENPV